MSAHPPDDDFPVLLPEVERQALLAYLTDLLTGWPVEQLHQTVDTLTEPGRAAAVVQDRRQRAAASQRWLAELREESRRRDPEGVARAEEQVRRASEEFEAAMGRRTGSSRPLPCLGILSDPPLA